MFQIIMASHSICHNGLFVCKYLKLSYELRDMDMDETWKLDGEAYGKW